jgi:hypothetical protein
MESWYKDQYYAQRKELCELAFVLAHCIHKLGGSLEVEYPCVLEYMYKDGMSRFIENINASLERTTRYDVRSRESRVVFRINSNKFMSAKGQVEE